MSNTITLTGAYGFTQYKLKNSAANTTIDAQTASWAQDNDGSDGESNPYPVAIVNAPGVVVHGGTILGQTDQKGDWRTIYDMGNSAGLRIESSANATIRDWTISNTWDALRISENSPNFLIEHVHVIGTRDDALENDKLMSGTIRDSLFDGVHAGISMAPSSSSKGIDGSMNTVTLDGVLMRLTPALTEGNMSHGSPFKVDKGTGADEVVPHIKITDTVIAIEKVDHNGYERLAHAWERVEQSSNNFFLNLSDTPLPANYPKPPAGFTILQGQAARDYWNKAKAEWINEHGASATAPATEEPTEPTTGPATELQPTPDTSVQEPASQPAPTMPKTTFSGTSFTGTNSAETIVGNDQANIINGRNGADTIWGGGGNDIFVFTRGGDMDGGGKVDLFMDFTQGADKFDFRAIDANEGKGGNQDFTFIGEADFGSRNASQVRAIYDSAEEVTRVELNTDADSKAEYWFEVAGKHAFTGADFFL
ncbi:M10 family metallopeptidase C-terminal domain-containing protein [Pseudaminobacter sp. 19-2017]|uniref:M10 family metallopeptidase C-terminal domain-containing protein n=1 Tax=Pseudaminobacter soli (ex Zhang et al. 2022) TaxID=2831468 RepID=A0A942E3Q4_9HYPH|nr:M10 family metallopeptidase C-terminal domain-containing protein [Pseudaminobacter soli]MBS3652432.1 M10 family metallopeptidase C-terminal domain-containing protein [Pseudaminobacter soli]